MSINDLLNMDLLPIMVIVFVVAIICILFGISKGKKTNNSIYGDDEYCNVSEEQNAKIISLRTSQHPLSPTIQVKTVVFELENGSRLELAIKDADTYSTMLEGDIGVLCHQGKKFLNWKRSIDNEI